MAEKTVYIRNLTSNPVNVRLGSKGTPFYLELTDHAGNGGLARRGVYGDIAQVPVSLVSHPSYQRSLNVIFEEISQQEAEAVSYEPLPDDDELVLEGRGRGIIRSHDVADIDPRLQIEGPGGYRTASGAFNKLAGERRLGDLNRLRNQGVGNIEVSAAGPEQVHSPTPPSPTDKGPKQVTRRGR
jgi:hypothetical protein